MNLNIEIKELFNSQKDVWTLARNNYNALNNIEEKEFFVKGIPFKVQFNPARIVSSLAKVDKKSIEARKCFLCAANRPCIQEGIEYQGVSDYYEILLNPYPIFPIHFTLPCIEHIPQSVSGRYIDMLNLAEQMTDFVMLYNGPSCGASAPDHMHFQAGNKGFLTIPSCLETSGRINGKLMGSNDIVCKRDGAVLYSLKRIIPGTLLFVGADKSGVYKLFKHVYNLLDKNLGEPMFNIVTWFNNGVFFSLVYLRRKHRPECYFADGEDNMMISPGVVDLSGVIIIPVLKDFERINETTIESVLNEVLVDDEFMNELCEKLK